MKPMKPRRVAALLACVLALSCDKDKKAADAPAADPNEGADQAGVVGGETEDAPAPKLAVTIRSEEYTNDGRPLWTVVREVPFKDFVEDRYQDVVDLVVQRDETVRARFVIYPGADRTIEIDKPKGKTVAVYCLFSAATGSSWKRLYEDASGIEVSLGRNYIVQDDSDPSAPEEPGSEVPQPDEESSP